MKSNNNSFIPNITNNSKLVVQYKKNRIIILQLLKHKRIGLIH